MEVAEAPVAATHSSARHFMPGWERNMSDEYQDDDDPAREGASQFVERKGLSRGDSAAIRYYQK